MRRKPLVLGANIIEQLQAADRLDLGRLNIGPPVQLPLILNSIAVTGSFHSVYTVETGTGAAVRRQLHNILGGQVGDILILTGTDIGDDISVRDDDGNLRLAGDFTLSASVDTMVLLCLGVTWIELARSNNG